MQRSACPSLAKSNSATRFIWQCSGMRSRPAMRLPCKVCSSKTWRTGFSPSFRFQPARFFRRPWHSRTATAPLLAPAVLIFCMSPPHDCSRRKHFSASTSANEKPQRRKDSKSNLERCSKPSNGDPLQIGAAVEMRVVAQQRESVFHHQGGDPEVVCRDGSAVLIPSAARPTSASSADDPLVSPLDITPIPN